MAQILVRGLDDETVKKLKDRAKQHGRSLQAEVKMILEDTAGRRQLTHEEALKASREFQKRFGGRGFEDSTKIIRAFRDSR